MLIKSSKELLPTEPRPKGQKWGSIQHEPPSSFTSPYSTEFNFSVTYSKISDVVVPYANIVDLLPEDKWIKEPPFANRKNPVLWMVSHCETHSRREDYVAELKQHIPVDIIGLCGNVSICPHDDRHDCDFKLVSKYFFYLAFENSLCDDYITEKTFARLQNGIIPVVLGNGNYARDLPVGSYIDVKDFESPRLLADHLKQIMASEELYATYHAWRSRQKIIHLNRLCEICRFAYDTIDRQIILPDINLHWNATRSCITPAKYYKGIL